MKAKVSKWGNSIGVRVPASIAADVGLAPGAEVEIVAEGRAIKIVPFSPRRFTLKALLEGLKKENLHGETSIGRAVGAEVIE
ncbi:MAG: AbrB/MazE/SpoVT family DNA-binding domain-containing protein [Gammaproteobacteria bacterium]|nr:AbrB/MazE/SpoVT family DNA-binding domain-containing protein [Gammaproteobacteria bacterium]